MSIRLRLTLLYSAILALTLLAFSGVLYAAQNRYTYNLVVNSISGDAQQMAMAWARMYYELGEHASFPWRMPRSNDDDIPDDMTIPKMLGRRGPQQETLRLLDAQGTALNVVGTSESESLPLDEQDWDHLFAGESWGQIADVEDVRVFVFNQPVIVEDELIGVVQISRSLADRDHSLRSLSGVLMLGIALTTFTAFGIGWIISGATLTPIHKLTQAAQEIGQARDFSSRVEYSGPPDEVGHLAVTFNEMLERLQYGYQQVTHALQVQRDFVADVSHELRTPLTTIRGNLSLLQHDPPLPEAEQDDILSDLTEESERLIRMVRDLLTLARADTGRQLSLGPLAVTPLLEDVCRQARVLAPEREIVYRGDEVLHAQANEDALKQVLLILLDNALKHADGAVYVEVSPETNWVVICVRDEGPGMSPELQSRIFDRFYRGDASRSTPGFGLGLSIAHALTEAQEGMLVVESERGLGSSFVIKLALVEVLDH